MTDNNGLISLEVPEDVADLLGPVQDRLGNLYPVMGEIGEIILESVQRNFEVGGRPRWQKLSPATIERRKKLKKWPGKILSVSGSYGLFGSVNYKATDSSVSIGTNKVYAATHQFGARKGQFGTVNAQIRQHVRRITAKGKKRKTKVTVRAHTRKMIVPWGNIPARPFLVVQTEDWGEIRVAILSYLTGEK